MRWPFNVANAGRSVLLVGAAETRHLFERHPQVAAVVAAVDAVVVRAVWKLIRQLDVALAVAEVDGVVLNVLIPVHHTEAEIDHFGLLMGV